ncbi:MAG TPA: hypothetical protein VMU06_13000 [Stellaceae bacterium]|nr:hypothetical protein [Stellaceae bacterium]
MEPLHTVTPAGLLTDFNIGQYDQVMADLKKKQAEDAKEKAIDEGIAKDLREKMGVLMAVMPNVLARDRQELSGHLAYVTHLVSDGVPYDMQKLLAAIKQNEQLAEQFLRAVTKGRASITKVKKLKAAATWRAIDDMLGEIQKIARTVISHYKFFFLRASELAAQAPAKEGRAIRAYALYREALKQIAAVKEVGKLEPENIDGLPLYRVQVLVEEAYFKDRSRVRADEERISASVGASDPELEGLLVLRYEPIAGAA